MQNHCDKILQTPSLAFLPINLAFPPENEPVLGYAMRSKTLKIFIVVHDGGRWYFVYGYNPQNIQPIRVSEFIPTHWAPLPKPQYYPITNSQTPISLIGTGPITEPDSHFPS